MFAPGHLGELTRYLPFELAGDVLEMTGTVQKRMRALPSRVGMYFVLAMTLFPGIGYLRVWDKMTAALETFDAVKLSSSCGEFCCQVAVGRFVRAGNAVASS